MANTPSVKQPGKSQYNRCYRENDDLRVLHNDIVESPKEDSEPFIKKTYLFISNSKKNHVSPLSPQLYMGQLYLKFF